MIKIYIEIWPGGDKKNRRLIAEGEIWNDGTGDLETGNYGCELVTFKQTELPGTVNIKGTFRSSVKNFKRLKNDIWELLRLFLNKGRKNK